MLILPDNQLISYSGRIDFDNPREPVFVYPCSSITVKFTGTYIKAIISNRNQYWDNYLGYIIDGEQKKIKLPKNGKDTIILAETLADTVHEMILFKRMDSCHIFTFFGLEIEDGAQLLPPPPKPSRKIEVFGDSVSAGEVSEAVEYVGKADPEHNGEYSNSWYSYAWMTARKLNAEIHDTAQGGIPLLDGTGWFDDPHFLGMESTYDKLEYNPGLPPVKPWDFSRYTPDVVIIALGQNDNHPEDYMAEDYNCEKAQHWRHEYRAFVEKLLAVYPNAEFILATTILRHDASWDQSIDQVCTEMNNPHVHHFLYSKNGDGTDGHIRIPEAEVMSDELAAYITSLGKEIWKEA